MEVGKEIEIADMVPGIELYLLKSIVISARFHQAL